MRLEELEMLNQTQMARNDTLQRKVLYILKQYNTTNLFFKFIIYLKVL